MDSEPVNIFIICMNGKFCRDAPDTKVLRNQRITKSGLTFIVKFCTQNI
jgi:hypothetical protein